MGVASVGRSRYADLRGVEQFIESRSARQVNLLLDFVGQQPGCYRPTVNEGSRSRSRQLKLWNLFKRGIGALAAVPYTSTHDEVNANTAVDVGGPNGEVLSSTVLAALRTYGPAYGVFPTGMGFGRPELWHYNAYPGRAIITTAATKPVPIELVSEKEEDTMSNMSAQLYLIQTSAEDAGAPAGTRDTWLVNPETFTYSHMRSDVQTDFWATLGAVRIDGVQPDRVLDGFNAVNEKVR
jgi:hypothetical protein